MNITLVDDHNVGTWRYATQTNTDYANPTKNPGHECWHWPQTTMAISREDNEIEALKEELRAWDELSAEAFNRFIAEFPEQ